MIKRPELRAKLESYFSSIYFEDDAIEKYYAHLKSKNMTRGKFYFYFLNRENLEKMSDEKLFWFSSYEKTGIVLTDFFSPKEIDAYSKNKLKKQDKIHPIIFENVLRIDEDQFVTTINTKKLYELYNGGALVYNVNTQRSPTVYRKDGKELYRPTINRRSVEEIKDLLLRDQFISNDLSFNLFDSQGLKRNDAKYKYDDFSNTLTISSGTLDMIDGFHRIMAINQVMTQNPDYDKNFVLNIMHFKEDKAKRFISQQDKRNKINSSYSKSLDKTRYENLVTTNLNENENSLLLGMIKTTGERAIDFGKTADAIKTIYHPANLKDVRDTTKEIINGLDDLFEDEIPDLNDAELKLLLIYISLSGDDSSMKEYKNVTEKLKQKCDLRSSALVLTRRMRDILLESRNELVQ